MQHGNVRVKLTGIGTNIGKHLHAVNFFHNTWRRGQKAEYSASGNDCIAIFKESENYVVVKTCLKDIVRDQKFDVEFYIGGIGSS